ncbi:unnamed protein product [Orchesella dallaii]|uniref:RCC1-like domain-containing protein n=1 Tax=Orchesella dallaii TaxID=48710 RepID=A0ABP1QJC9_9HEXA
MPRKVTKAVQDTETIPQENKTSRKIKRPAEDVGEEPPTKAQKTAVLAKSSQPKTKKGTGSAKPAVEAVKSPETSSASSQSRKRKSPELPTTAEGATLHCFGTNDCGQLGFTCEKRKFPALVPSLENKKITAVACGGMHTIVLEDNGSVWSFGLNDDKALGRFTKEEEDAFEPGKVDIKKKVTQISAGDSHSAALTEDGEVYAWGCFKDNNGNYGLIADDGEICREKPELLTRHLGTPIVKISSGAHHIAMLGADGYLYTCGTGEQGQLGRQPEKPKRVTRSMGAISGSPVSHKEYLLKPAVVKITRSQRITDLWTGEFSTYCVTDKSKDVYVCGLNNYAQLGIRKSDEKTVIQVPTKNTTFKGRKWKQIAAGQHHAIALSEEGKVFTLGRNTDGRLGIGSETEEQDIFEPILVEGLADKKCVLVAAGASTSYAVTEAGLLYSWGFGENFQLAAGDDDDRDVPTQCFGKPNTPINGKVVNVSAGGQHVGVTILVTKLLNGNAEKVPKVNGK